MVVIVGNSEVIVSNSRGGGKVVYSVVPASKTVVKFGSSPEAEFVDRTAKLFKSPG